MIVSELVLNDLITKWFTKIKGLQDRIYIASIAKLDNQFKIDDDIVNPFQYNKQNKKYEKSYID